MLSYEGYMGKFSSRPQITCAEKMQGTDELYYDQRDQD